MLLVALFECLLLLLVVVVIFFPSISNRSRASTPQQVSQPLAGSFQPASQPLAGSFQPASLGDAELMAAIDRANSAFRTAHERADLAALEGVATGAWLEQERGILADLRARGLTERWRQRSFRLIGLAGQGATATVCTDEEWERVVVDASGRHGPAEPRHHIEQYTLQRVGAVWLVSAIAYDTEAVWCVQVED